MKKLVLAAALAAATTTTASAGSMADPIVEAPVVEEQAGSSVNSVWVPLLLIAVIAIAAGSKS